MIILYVAHYLLFKGTVSVILSDPPCKDGYARISMVPLQLNRIAYKLYPIKFQLDINVFVSLKLSIFICGFSAKLTCAFLVHKN